MSRVLLLLPLFCATVLAQNQPPTVGTITGTGTAGAYWGPAYITFNDPEGNFADIQVVVNTALSATNSCYVYYDFVSNGLWLADDAGAWQGPARPGASGILQNSRCAVDVAHTSVYVYTYSTPKTATLYLTMAFSGAFSGSKNVWALVEDSSGLTSGWQQRGAYIVNVGANQAPVASGVYPSSSAGNTVNFTAVAYDANGYMDLSSVDFAVGQSTSLGNSCYLRYNRAAQSVALADDAGNFGVPVPMGSTTPLSNSQCSVDVSLLPQMYYGPYWYLRPAITFKSVYLGQKTLYLSVSDAAGLSSGLKSMGTYWVTPAANHSPTADSVVPGSGTGASQTFTVTASDPDGAVDLANVYFRVQNTSGANPPTCQVNFNIPQRTASLLSDTGTEMTPVNLGGAVTVQNGVCTFNAGTSSISTSGNSAVIQVSLTFTPAFASGAKTTSVFARDGSGAISGWTNLGTWSVPAGANQPPAVGAVTLPYYGGSPFVFQFSDPNGSDDLNAMEFVVNSSLTPSQSCYFLLSRASNTFYLADDTGVFGSGIPIGTVGVLSNSRCAIDVKNSGVSAGVTTLQVSVYITFRPGYGTTKNVWAMAYDRSSATSTWKALGAYSVPYNSAPYGYVSFSSYGLSNLFGATVTDSDGYPDVATVELLIGSTRTAANSCYVKYAPAANQLFLADDAGSWLGPLTPGNTGTLQNSQCVLDGATTTVSPYTQTIYVSFALSFKTAFAGVKNVYYYYADFAGHNPGWQTSGNTYNVASNNNFPPGTPAVTPGAASGTSQAFTFTFTDPNGYSDITTAYMLIGNSTAATNSCYVRFDMSGNKFWLADDAGNWQGPVVPGASATISNSRCSLSAATASYTSYFPNYYGFRLVVPLSFTSVYTGVQKIYASATDSYSATSGWVQVGSYTLPGGVVNQAPVAVSVSPSSGSGQSQAFAFTFSDGNGAADIVGAQIDIAPALTSIGACYVYFDRASSQLWLANDAGSAWSSTAVAIGSSSTLSNNQCTIGGSGSAVSVSGNNLTLTIPFAFKSTYLGAKSVYALVSDTAAANSGWQTLGAYTVAAAPVNQPPVAASVTPASGSGSAQVFQFTLTDADGAANISAVQIVINNALTAVNSCYIYFSRAANSLYLAADTGIWQTGIGAGSSATSSNSRCTINASGSSWTGSGTTATVSVSVTFTAGFAGGKSVWALAEDAVSNSGWKLLGAYTATSGTANTPPVAASVAPSAASGTVQAFQFTLTDGNGYADITAAQIVVNGSLSSASSCYIYVARASNTLFLASDGGTWQPGIVAGSSASSSNSRCTLNAGGSAVAGSGNTLTVTLSVTFQSAFPGAKKIWALAEDAVSNSGWQQLGAYTVAAGGGNSAPVAVSVSPASGSGSGQSFTFTFSDANGYADITAAQVVINDTLSAANSCYLYFSRPANMIYLASDAGVWQPGMVITTSNTSSSNSRCTVASASASSSGSGNNLTLTVYVAFKTAGDKQIWALAEDAYTNSGWQQLGSFTAR